MNVALLVAACLSRQAGATEPVLWMKLDGSIQVYSMPLLGESRPAPRMLARPPRLMEGTSVVRVPGGLGYDFDGKFSGVMIEDAPSLRLSTPFTICCWVKLRTYVDRGPGAQIVFRGDDRGGLDPYQLVILPDGKIVMAVHNEDNIGTWVSAPIGLERWTHVVASADSRNGVMNLWLNGEKVATSPLKGIRPLMTLDAGTGPGVGIGNVQNNGHHNQPLNGTLADLRIYNCVVEPREAGYGSTAWPVGERKEVRKDGSL